MAIRIRKKSTITKQNSARTMSPSELISLAEKSGLQTSPLDLNGLCRVLGIALKYSPLSDNLSGTLSYENGHWSIKVNALHHERRQRFTIAHELAHYFLHREHQSNFDGVSFARGEHYTEQELEADNYAGALLMPKDKLIEFIRNKSNKIECIADHFGASGIAVKKRADVIRFGSYEY